jgi:hypothetical protein
MNSTDGPLASAKITCPRGNHFNGPIDCLTVPEQSAATAESASPPPANPATTGGPRGQVPARLLHRTGTVLKAKHRLKLIGE